MDPKRPTSRLIIIKMTYHTQNYKAYSKERILKATREKQVVTFKGATIRLSPEFSAEAFQARRDCHEIFKVMKSKDLQARLLYPARLSFKIEGEIRKIHL